MKYLDYYGILGVAVDASGDTIRKAYRRQAQRCHPDLGFDPAVAAAFKPLAEAYSTLADSDLRAAYDRLGRLAAESEFEPPPEWTREFLGPHFPLEGCELADLFTEIRRRWRHAAMAPRRGADCDATVHVRLEEAYASAEVPVTVTVPESDPQGRLREVSRLLPVRLPKGATAGRTLLLRGQGGRGLHGGGDGDLYVHVALQPHAIFRVSGHDLYLDLPLTPWEAALGLDLDVPLPGGALRLRAPPGIRAGQRLHLPKGGLPKADGEEGDAFAIVQIVLPVVLNERERELLQELAAGSTFDPRAHLGQELEHEARLS